MRLPSFQLAKASLSLASCCCFSISISSRPLSQISLSLSIVRERVRRVVGALAEEKKSDGKTENSCQLDSERVASTHASKRFSGSSSSAFSGCCCWKRWKHTHTQQTQHQHTPAHTHTHQHAASKHTFRLAKRNKSLFILNFHCIPMPITIEKGKFENSNGKVNSIKLCKLRA